eukprot:6193943-Heterocapsa_arctica.AAC.1
MEFTPAWMIGTIGDFLPMAGVVALSTLSTAHRQVVRQVVRLLLEAGADKDKVRQDGDTPLMFASRNGHLELAHLLLTAGADKDKARQ